MTDPLKDLARLPRPKLPPELSLEVKANAQKLLARGERRPLTRSEAVLAVVVACLSLLHVVWTVGFVNQLH